MSMLSFYRRLLFLVYQLELLSANYSLSTIQNAKCWAESEYNIVYVLAWEIEQVFMKCQEKY
jgi:hypothetical protein